MPVGGAFFLRVESFFDIATAAERASERASYEDTQLLASFGWRSPHSLSHGQAFVGLFQGRMTGRSLWFMDEPEAALSFRSQLVLLAEINTLVGHDAQFVIATHSPVLTALPDAAIYEFTEQGNLGGCTGVGLVVVAGDVGKVEVLRPALVTSSSSHPGAARWFQVRGMPHSLALGRHLRRSSRGGGMVSRTP